MGIKITIQISKTLDVGDPDEDVWICVKGHRISPSTMELDGRWDFEDRVWYHQEMAVLCGYAMHMYRKDSV